MSIVMMCSKDTPGAYVIEYPGWDAEKMGPLYMVKSYEGRVLSLRERNGYDDSDFYAVVWPEGGGGPVEVMYATTRGWTYPNGANIDASPEVRAEYEAWAKEAQAKRRAEREALKAASGEVGQMVEISGCRGKNAGLNGKSGEVFWKGVDAYSRSYYGAPPKFRLGVKLADGSKVFVAAERAKVVGAEKDCSEAIRSLQFAQKLAAYGVY